MTKHWIGLLFLLIAFTGSAFTRDFQPASAPPGPDRYAVITVQYIAYDWRMATWKGRKEVCAMVVDHEGVPTPSEVYSSCGATIYNKWFSQKPCNLAPNKNLCDGYYIYDAGNWPAEKEVGMELPPAEAWVTLEDCVPVISTSTNICESAPMLVISGQEPLVNEKIIRVAGTYDDQPFVCDESSACKFQVQETGEEGVTVKFWAYSSYGDSSVAYTAQVRVRLLDEGDPDQKYWYVDVLSTQWQGQAVATCADSWASFPPVGGPPEWLTTPVNSEELSSDIPYTYLAANLILQGVVDARACPDGGLLPGGGVNQCGLEKARDAVNEWQNRFDTLILTTAQETGVPARLLKNLFARESQFWPGIFQAAADVGLGQLTEDGADTTLFWNPSFYEQFCPIVLPSKRCGKGYIHLKAEEKILLRQSLVASVNATCQDCPLGLDLTQADFSITVFAHTLIANCEQTGQVVHNYTAKTPGAVASFEDLWKFTLVNYNAGPTCLADAISGAQGNNLEITWENISPHLSKACQGAIDYVNDISK
jgi:hypothetical protein